MRLETSDGLAATSLPDRLDGLTHANRGVDWLELGIDSREVAGVHGGREVEQQVVVLVQNGCLDVQTRVHHHEKAAEG